MQHPSITLIFYFLFELFSLYITLILDHHTFVLIFYDLKNLKSCQYIRLTEFLRFSYKGIYITNIYCLLVITL